MKSTVAAVLLLWLPALGCSPNGRDSAVHLFESLRSGDSRVLDETAIDAALIRAAGREGDHALYALGRAFEDRGLTESASRLYRAEIARGSGWWSARAAVRLARIAASRGRWDDARAAADEARAIDPFDADAAFWAGEARYRDERFSELSQWLDRLEGTRLVDGETVSAAEVHREALLWRAVTAWELDRPDATAAMTRAFTAAAADPIHRRLYLYLFYRAGALARFEPHRRLLLEAVYRAAVEEDAEARRLFRMIEPAALLAEGAETSAALAATFEQIHAPRDADWNAWLERVVAEAGSRAPTGDPNVAPAHLAGWFSWSRDPSAADRQATGALVDALPREPAVEPLRSLLVDRWLDESLRVGAPPEEIVDALARWDVAGPIWTRAVDRLMPTLVRGRDWEAVERLADGLARLPAARDAAEHAATVVTIAARHGYLPEAPQRRASLEVGRVPPDYVAMLARMETGRGWQPAPTEDEPRALPDPTAPVLTDDAQRFLQHAIALTSVGLAEAGTRLAMRAALEPVETDALLALAARLARQGRPRLALDLSRRAVARSGIEPDTAQLALLYPLIYRAEIDAAAEPYGLDAMLVTALIREESHFNPRARSPVGATGLMQLMPDTAADVMRRMRLDGLDPEHPGDNLALGTFYLDYLAGRVEDPILRLAAYNAGQGRARRWETEFGDLPGALRIEAIPFVETRWYLRRIAVSYAMYRYRVEGTDPIAAFRSFLGEDAQ